MMKLTAFRIKNFRSIVDTGWQNLSPDNITCLIGQNESGKTSVLEALKIFNSGIISEDVLRSDLSMPEVSCRFTIQEGWLLKITENPGAELTELLTRLDQLELTRKWLQDFSSVITVSGEISQYLDSLDDAWKLYLDDVSLRLEKELGDISVMEARLAETIEEESSIRSQLSSGKGNKLGFMFFRKKSAGPVIYTDHQYSEMKSRLNDLKKVKDKITVELAEKQSIKRVGDKWKKLQEKFISLDNHLKELSGLLEERHQKMTLLMKPMADDNDYEWKSIINDFRKTRVDRDQKKAEMDRQVALSGYIIDGIAEPVAEQKVDSVIDSYRSKYNSEILGRKYFENCPVFELFEDFGSLLPNRIDMDDIISGNEKVEGYKAARNFLSIAQLNYSFFNSLRAGYSSRRLKTLTILLHEIFTISGSNLLEAIIKFIFSLSLNIIIPPTDLKRVSLIWSSGSRMFLSFYMELKASANNNNKQLILLVDEPGVSLHARAQEDVLKVFDDIRDKIQHLQMYHPFRCYVIF
ncbi:MAG: AAA family ATPase [Bacteroidales bacterium]|nr:AAA family ATPase [Bacteroidales bacterium]